MQKLFDFFNQLKFRYLLTRSIVRVGKNTTVFIDKNVCISHSKINIFSGSKLTVEENVTIKNVILNIDGEVYIGKNTIIDNGYQLYKIKINVKGNMYILNNSRIRCANIWIRFGGVLRIGNYTNINEESEIRVDEQISIGDYNQISYKCVIWDTNTHNIYPAKERRNQAEKYFPLFGYEFEKPKTKKVMIGNDCWIGREVAILKGTTINNGCIIAYRAIVSNCEIESGKLIVSQVNNVIYKTEVNDTRNSNSSI